MFKILKTDFSIFSLNIEDVGPWEVVGSTVIHGDGCARLRIESRIAIIFDMALSAHQIGIRFVENPDGPEGFSISYLVALVQESKEKLFATKEQNQDGPSEEDDQEDNELPD
jgi:hypothetical protein